MDNVTVILFEDDEIRVLWRPGASVYALVTFGDLMTLANGTRFFADIPVSKLGITCVGFMAKRANWFPADSCRAAAPFVLAKLAPYQDRIVYGGSMGGYAALKFSALLQATHIIAYCPQWSLDRVECGGVNPGWRECFTPAMAGMGIRADDVAGEAYIFYDPHYRFDAFHAQKIRQSYPSARSIAVPLVDHNVTTVFAGTEILGEVISACRLGDGVALAGISRRVRRARAQYTGRVFHYIVQKRPEFALSQMRQRGTEWLTEDSMEPVFRIAAYAAAHGETAYAADCLILFQRRTSSIVKQAAAAGMRGTLTGAPIYIRSAHNLVLAFNPAEDCCMQVPDNAPLLGSFFLPVNLRQTGNVGTLYCTTAVGSIKLGIDERGTLTSRAAKAESEFMLASPRPGYFTLCHEGSFLAAEPSGRVVCDRPLADAWEQFIFG